MMATKIFGAKAVPTKPRATRIPEMIMAVRQLKRSIRKLDTGPENMRVGMNNSGAFVTIWSAKQIAPFMCTVERLELSSLTTF